MNDLYIKELEADIRAIKRALDKVLAANRYDKFEVGYLQIDLRVAKERLSKCTK